MKRIILKEMKLVNFKGIGSLEIKFNESETTILGANHAGKTSTFDAFIWLLFGKDSKDRKDYEIKTYDKNGVVIPKLPHEVSAVININGVDTTFRRVYTEVWAKERGTIQEVLRSHKTDTYINDVPMKLSEYKARVDEIVDENLFRLITDPLYFPTQHWEKQRKFLFNMAGEISDSDIVERNPEFQAVLDMLTGKSVEDLSREIASKKKAITDKMKLIPTRRDEAVRGLIEDRDWDSIEASIKSLSEDVDSMKNQSSAYEKAMSEAAYKRRTIASDIEDKRTEVMKHRMALTRELESGYYNRLNKYEDDIREIKSLKFKLSSVEGDIKFRKDSLTHYRQKREDLLTTYHAINDSVFDENISSVECPVCHRKYEGNMLEETLEQLRNEFNTRKARDLEHNKKLGLEVRESIRNNEEALKSLEERKSEIEAKLAELGTPTFTEELPDVNAAVASDEVTKSLTAEIAALTVQLDSVVAETVPEELTSQIAEKKAEINQLVSQLSYRNIRNEQLKRIEELDAELRSSADALAKLEGIEAQVLSFNQARAELIEERINSLFRIVRFKLFETQINGSTVECCEATADGVPFSTKSTSEQINMGLDIINAICTKNEVFAPIFIDNRECITEILPMSSQIINLRVDENHKSLFIL